MKIYVKTLKGSQFEVEVNGEDTVRFRCPVAFDFVFVMMASLP